MDVDSLMSQLTAMNPAGAVESVQTPAAVPAEFQQPGRIHDFPLPSPSMPMSAGIISPAQFTGIQLEHRTPALKVGHKGLISLRLTAAAAGRFELTVSSDLMPEEQMSEGSCLPITPQDAGSVRFVPEIAGSEEVRVNLALLSETGLPVSRWTGNFVINVEPAEGNSIQAGGDVIVMGGGAPGIMNAAAAADAQWHEIDLAIDADFAARAERICPTEVADFPALPDRDDSFSGVSGALYFGDDDFTCYGVTVGDAVTVGRGGRDDVDWWLNPVSEAENLAGRISRKHLKLEFRNGRAWVASLGSNGSSLNGQTLLPSKATLLADGDELNLAGALTLVVRLHSDGSQVVGVELNRTDRLAQSIRMLLVRAGQPVRLGQASNGFWAAWSKKKSVQLHDPENGWDNLVEAEEHYPACLNGAGIAWYDLGSVVDQDQLLGEDE